MDIATEREGSSLLASISNSNPERCVRLSRNPSVHVYYALKMRLEQCSPQWLQGFIDLGGLETLLDSLEKFNGRGFTNFSDAVLQLDCTSCIKSILNTQFGMAYFVEQENYTRKLMMALNTPNLLPKKQIFELLTVVCIYSHRGRYLVMESLDHLKKSISAGHMFSVIIEELKVSDTTAYRKSLLAFVNVLVGSHDRVEERCRIREMLIALGLLDAIQLIKKDEKDADLAIQLETFHTGRHQDEEVVSRLRGIDVTDPLAIFHKINDKVFAKPEAASFLHILQDLYIMSSASCDSSLLWQTMAKATTCIATAASGTCADNFLERLKSSLADPQSSNNSKNEVTNEDPPLMKRISKQLFLESDQPKEKNVIREDSKAASKASKSKRSSRESKERSKMELKLGKRFALPNSPLEECNRRDSGISVTSNPSPYDNVPTREFKRLGAWRIPLGQKQKLSKVEEKTSQQDSSAAKLKCVPWVRVPNEKATRLVSIWKQMSEPTPSSIKIDYLAIEDEFIDSGIQDTNDEIQLLSNQQSLDISIFLARLEASPEELAECFSEGDDASISVHAFKHLIKILPTKEEISQLRRYSGSRYDLGQAEQFLLCLSDIPGYDVLLNGLLFKTEFKSKFPKLRDNFQAMITACRDVLHHPGFRDFVAVMLNVGNFMNKNNHIGACQGVSLPSWQALYEVRGQSHHSRLLGTIIRQIELQDNNMMLFINDFPSLGTAAENSLDNLRSDMTLLNEGLKKLLAQLSNAHKSVKSIFQVFIEDVKVDLEHLHSSVARLKGLSQQLALYFCEDEAEFDLQKTLQHLLQFCDVVKKCKKNGYQSRLQSDMASERIEVLRNNPPKQTLQIYSRATGAVPSITVTNNKGLLETILGQIHQGEIRRYRDEERMTPDIEDNLLFSRLAPPITSTPSHPGKADGRLGFKHLLLDGKQAMPSPLYLNKEDIISAQPCENMIQANTEKESQLTDIVNVKLENELEPCDGQEKQIEGEKEDVKPAKPISLLPLVKHEQDFPSPLKKAGMLLNSPIIDDSVFECSPVKEGGKLKKSSKTDEELCTSWILQHWEKNENEEKKTFVDRVEQVIDRRYHRDQQRLTGSFIDDEIENFPEKEVTGKRSGIVVYPKITSRQAVSPVSRRTHRRSNSNIDHSQAGDKWLVYEKENKAKVQGSDQHLESSNNVISLGLERQGKLLSGQDLLQTVPEDEPVPFKKEKKRSSFGFIKKLTKALGHRNMNAVDEDNKTRKPTTEGIKKDRRLRKNKVRRESKENHLTIEYAIVGNSHC